MFNINVFFKFICGIIIVYTLVWLFLRWKLRIYFERFKNVKSIPGLPLPIGHGHRIIGKNIRILELFDAFALLHSDGPLLLWPGPFPTILVSNPNDISAVMRSPNGLKKHYSYRFFENKAGLATAPVDQWRFSRRLLNPTFNFKMLQSFMPIFNECSAKLVRNLRKELDGNLFDCYDEILLCALSMSCLTTLGYELHLQEYQNGDFREAITEAAKLISHRCFNIWFYPDFIYEFTENSKRLKKFLGRIYGLSDDIVQHKKQEYHNMSAEEKFAIFDMGDITKPNIFLTQILHMAEDNNLSDLYIREQVDTILFAGSETTTETLANTVLALAMYPDIQERVYREIMDVTNGADSIEYDMISKLVYTEMVIKETLRLYPIAPFLPRESTGDIEISNCTIPKGTPIIVIIYNLHRDRSIWGQDADLFNPDNFLPEKIIKQHPASFIPFSYGPRNCIAMKYAMISMKVMLCHLLRNYKFTTPLKAKDLTFRYYLTLKLVNRHMVSMNRRND